MMNKARYAILAVLTCLCTFSAGDAQRNSLAAGFRLLLAEFDAKMAECQLLLISGSLIE